MAVINKGNVLTQGSPDDAINELSGKIWKRSVEKDQLDAMHTEFEVISTRLVAGKPLIHIFSESKPDAKFEATDADLEDVYFLNIARATVEA